MTFRLTSSINSAPQRRSLAAARIETVLTPLAAEKIRYLHSATRWRFKQDQFLKLAPRFVGRICFHHLPSPRDKRQSRLRRLSAGDTIDVTALRGDKPVKLKVTLGVPR
jgi:hypothetical protein